MTSRATSHEHVAPKLPSRSPDEVEAAFVAANALPPALVEPAERGPRPPAAYENPVVFEVPELLPLRAVGIAWMAARVAVFLWTAAIAFVAIRTAGRIDSSAPEQSISDVGDDMTNVVLVGVLLVVALLAASVLWSRSVAENTRRLRGRWPSLNRATRVWFYPTVWVALAALTFLRVEVTEFDPLPAIAATVFAITLYCPYSMLQRIFKTLTRLRPEGEIRAAYLLDLAGFGIIWWRLTDWPDPITASDSGTVDAMAWAAITSSGLLLISAGITANLVRQTIAAQRYRIRVLATRHIQGLALPLIPRKAWGRERTSIDDAAARGAGPVGDVVRAADLVIGPGGAPSAAVAAARRTVVPARGTDAAPPRSTSTTAGDRLAPRRKLTAGGDEGDGQRAGAGAGETPVSRRRPGPGAAGQVAARRRPGPTRDGSGMAARRRPGAAHVGGSGAPNRRAAVDGAVAARRQPVAGQPRGTGRRRAAVPGAAGAAVARRRAASGTTTDTASRRALAAAAAARRAAAVAAAAGDPAERSADEPGSDVVRRAASTAGHGTPPGGQPGPPRNVPAGARHVDADEPPEPTTFFGALRFVALGAHVALAATFVWFVVEARSAATSSGGGDLSPTRIDRLDLVRTANVVAFAVTVLLLGAWGTVISMLARRADRPAPPPWLIAALCLPATLLALVGLVIDGRVGEGVAFRLAVLAAALGGACSLILLSMMSRDVDDSSQGIRIWSAVIAIVGLGLTITAYLQPIEPDESLSTMTLVAVLMSILVGLGVLLGALASGELDELVVETETVDAVR